MDVRTGDLFQLAAPAPDELAAFATAAAGSPGPAASHAGHAD